MNAQNPNWGCGLGYHLSHKRYPHAPGFSRLEIFINAVPTGEHFDPHRVEFPICDKKGNLTTLTITHPWRYETEHRASVGTIELVDHKDKKIGFYTFGGALKINENATCTALQLNSPAPIIDLSDVGSPPMSLPKEYSLDEWLADEFQCLFAERKASNLPKTDAYETHLAGIPPLELYVASLLELQQRFAHQNNSLDEIHQKAKAFIQNEIRTLMANELWPKNAERLSKLI